MLKFASFFLLLFLISCSENERIDKVELKIAVSNELSQPMDSIINVFLSTRKLDFQIVSSRGDVLASKIDTKNEFQLFFSDSVSMFKLHSPSIYESRKVFATNDSTNKRIFLGKFKLEQKSLHREDFIKFLKTDTVKSILKHFSYTRN